MSDKKPIQYALSKTQLTSLEAEIKSRIPKDSSYLIIIAGAHNGKSTALQFGSNMTTQGAVLAASSFAHNAARGTFNHLPEDN